MGDSQSVHAVQEQGRTSTNLFERISDDIGSGNEGDMLDMQCTVNQDPSVTILSKKEYHEVPDIGMHSMQTT